MKVLFMSGYAEYTAARHDIIDQDAPSLQKPFAMDTLAPKIREVLESQPVAG